MLAEFVRTESESAFAALVARYVNLVYSTAFRFTGNAHHAEEVTQAVFIILARKAGSLGAKTVLSGWLYHTARLTAANAQRAEMRRIRHEQEAFMQSIEKECAPDALWRELSPLLEDAMAGLGANDRDALVLRYFQNLSLAGVGATLGITEGVAQRRVSRALGKLRRFFARRGVNSTTAIIAGAISSNSLQAAPSALAQSVTAAALVKGAAASASTLTLVKGALKVMAWTKAKTAVVIGVAVLLSAGTAIIVEVAHGRTAEQDKTILSKVIAANRFWLLAPPDTVADYSYALHLQWTETDDEFPVPSQWNKAPDGSIQTPVQVSHPRNAPADEREGTTYSSVLQWLAEHPELARVQSIKKGSGTITLALKFVPAPGARTFVAIRGVKYPIPPLQIECGFGNRNNHSDHFTTGGTNAVVVIDTQKMVPLSCFVPTGYQEAVEETFSNYVEVSPGNYVPLAVSIKYTGWPREWGEGVFDSTFKLHDGVWLFDEGRYHGEKVSWTDQVVVH